MYLYCSMGGLVGVSAHGENAGQILFKTSEWNPSVIAPSPIHLGGGRLYVTAGYGSGSMLFQLTKGEDGLSIHTIASLKPDEGLASEQQTPIFHDGHLFAILPKDAGSMRNQFICSRADDPKTIVWTSGKTNRFGLGPYVIADNKFFILSDDGVLTLARVSTREYHQLAQAQILTGHDAWAPMAIVNGRLLARDSRRMVCLDVRDHS
jgi:outer membrane protein assembly factor BamB